VRNPVWKLWWADGSPIHLRTLDLVSWAFESRRPKPRFAPELAVWSFFTERRRLLGPGLRRTQAVILKPVSAQDSQRSIELIV
jgi:hypothetical protein